jgi:ATP-dependent helicase/nuclease subunit A
VGGTVVAGQVDRLAVAEDSVTIIDYKTNRPPPARAEGTPAAYLLQLALYRALVRAIYPGRAVRSVIVWTDGCRVMPIADALIDAVEARDLTVRGAAP